MRSLPFHTSSLSSRESAKAMNWPKTRLWVGRRSSRPLQSVRRCWYCQALWRAVRPNRKKYRTMAYSSGLSTRRPAAKPPGQAEPGGEKSREHLQPERSRAEPRGSGKPHGHGRSAWAPTGSATRTGPRTSARGRTGRGSGTGGSSDVEGLAGGDRRSVGGLCRLLRG